MNEVRIKIARPRLMKLAGNTSPLQTFKSKCRAVFNGSVPKLDAHVGFGTPGFGTHQYNMAVSTDLGMGLLSLREAPKTFMILDTCLDQT